MFVILELRNKLWRVKYKYQNEVDVLKEVLLKLRCAFSSKWVSAFHKNIVLVGRSYLLAVAFATYNQQGHT